MSEAIRPAVRTKARKDRATSNAICGRQENQAKRNDELPKNQPAGAIPLIEKEVVAGGLNTGGRQSVVDGLEKEVGVESSAAAANAKDQLIVVEGEHVNPEDVGSSDSNHEVVEGGSHASRKRKSHSAGSGREKGKRNRADNDPKSPSDPSTPQTEAPGSSSEVLTREKALAMATKFGKVPQITGVPCLARSGPALLLGTALTKRGKDAEFVQQLRGAKMSPTTYHARFGLMQTEMTSMMEAMTADFKACYDAEMKENEQLILSVGAKEEAEKKLKEAEENINQLTAAYESLMAQKNGILKEVEALKADKAKLEKDGKILATGLKAAENKFDKMKTDYESARTQIEEMRADHQTALADAKLDAVEQFRRGGEFSKVVENSLL